MDPPGIEPGLPARQAGVIPLDHEPMPSVESRGFEPRSPAREAGVFPLDDNPMLSSDQGGSRTHNHQALDLTAIPVRVPGHQSQTWESNPAAGLMRPSRAPARLRVVMGGVEPPLYGF